MIVYLLNGTSFEGLFKENVFYLYLPFTMGRPPTVFDGNPAFSGICLFSAFF